MSNGPGHAASGGYWPTLMVDEVSIDLTHLEPFRLTCHIERLERSLTIDIKFTNHCFTDHFVEGVHDSARIVMDHKQQRVFCATRYGLSKLLPDMVRGLPTATVYQTRHERNYVYAVALDDGAGGSYPMFFTLKKERTTWHQLALVVESAYGVTAAEMASKLAGGRPLPFPVLCAKTFTVQPIRPKTRR